REAPVPAGLMTAPRSSSGLERARRLTLVQFGILGRRWRRFLAWFHGLELSENAILISFAVAVGVVGALGVVAFYELIDLAYAGFYRTPSERLPPGVMNVVRPVVTGAGLFTAWWIMRRLGRAHEGLNVPDVQLAVARREGVIPLRPALAR